MGDIRIDMHQKRQQNAAYYDAEFANLSGVITPVVAQNRAFHVYNQYVIRVPQRDELRRHLTSKDIGSEVYYPLPFHMQECFAYLDYLHGTFPHAEAAARETLALPIYPELTQDMLDYVVSNVVEFYA